MAIWPGRKDQQEGRLGVGSTAGDATSGRATAGAAGPPGAAGAGEGDELKQLTERLAELGGLLNRANEQVIAHLLRRESPAEAGTTSGSVTAGGAAPADATSHADLAALSGRMDALGDKLDGIQRQSAALGENMAQLQQRLDDGLKELKELAEQLRSQQADRPDAPVEAAVGAAMGAAVAAAGAAEDWQLAILGPELAEHPGLDFQRQQLLEGVLRGDPGACALVGQLLVFRSALSDKMPPLLKDIGEAYYRWQPKTRPGSNPMEEALVRWLSETMQEAGIPNTIELVHPGQRFDATRHTASTRGVEITEVHGWIVLRDNGRVYTKASVAVK